MIARPSFIRPRLKLRTQESTINGLTLLQRTHIPKYIPYFIFLVELYIRNRSVQAASYPNMQAVISSSIGVNPRLAGPFHTSFLGSRHALNSRNTNKSCKKRTFSPQAIATPPTFSSGSAPTANQAPEEGLQASSSSSFDWKDYWYPVVFEHDVAPGQLYKFTLLNTPIVIWRDGAAVRAFKDACPHRLVPLSEGRIAPSGCLECPYHGKNYIMYQFSASLSFFLDC